MIAGYLDFLSWNKKATAGISPYCFQAKMTSISLWKENVEEGVHKLFLNIPSGDILKHGTIFFPEKYK